MNRKLLVCIGFLMFFTLVLCDEFIGQGRKDNKVPISIHKI